jgi:hypothetical protein
MITCQSLDPRQVTFQTMEGAEAPNPEAIKQIEKICIQNCSYFISSSLGEVSCILKFNAFTIVVFCS